MIDAEVADMSGTNKNVQTFILAFDEAKTTTDIETIQRNKYAINSLKENTVHISEQRQSKKDQIKEAMKLPTSNLYFMYMLLAINVLVFIFMAIDGAELDEPNGLVHIRWGSDFTPFTLSGGYFASKYITYFGAKYTT